MIGVVPGQLWVPCRKELPVLRESGKARQCPYRIRTANTIVISLTEPPASVRAGIKRQGHLDIQVAAFSGRDEFWNDGGFQNWGTFSGNRQVFLI